MHFCWLSWWRYVVVVPVPALVVVVVVAHVLRDRCCWAQATAVLCQSIITPVMELLSIGPASRRRSLTWPCHKVHQCRYLLLCCVSRDGDCSVQVTVDPETPEAEELRSWWSSEGSTATITPLSQVCVGLCWLPMSCTQSSTWRLSCCWRATHGEVQLGWLRWPTCRRVETCGQAWCTCCIALIKGHKGRVPDRVASAVTAMGLHDVTSVLARRFVSSTQIRQL